MKKEETSKRTTEDPSPGWVHKTFVNCQPYTGFLLNIRTGGFILKEKKDWGSSLQFGLKLQSDRPKPQTSVARTTRPSLLQVPHAADFLSCTRWYRFISFETDKRQWVWTHRWRDERTERAQARRSLMHISALSCLPAGSRQTIAPEPNSIMSVTCAPKCLTQRPIRLHNRTPLSLLLIHPIFLWKEGKKNN